MDWWNDPLTIITAAAGAGVGIVGVIANVYIRRATAAAIASLERPSADTLKTRHNEKLKLGSGLITATRQRLRRG